MSNPDSDPLPTPNPVQAQPAVAPGLCGQCRHARVIETARAVYFFCRRSATDSAYRKYPVLPVSQCRGHEPQDR